MPSHWKSNRVGARTKGENNWMPIAPQQMRKRNKGLRHKSTEVSNTIGNGI